MPSFGVVGLSTMGANLARNAVRNGATVAVFNRTHARTEEFMDRYGDEGTFLPCKTVAELRDALTPPRVILLMVKAGQPVDDVIKELLPVLQSGDILIDGGNSFYRDSERREKELLAKGIHFLGMGVSGGEHGALYGPSMMPGGSKEAYDHLRVLFEAMAAHDGDGGACISYLGSGGVGHFVKMIHNGIEYGMMQLIAEAYDMLRTEGGMSNDALADLFALWNQGEDLQSYLVEITADILRYHDEDGAHLVDHIRDAALGKGTGKWTVEAGMLYGAAIPTITAAVEARVLSGDTEQRKERQKELPESLVETDVKPLELQSQVRSALALSFVVTYAQGFDLLAKASCEEGWNLDLAEVARIWRGGCIIRSSLLRDIQAAQSSDLARARSGKQKILDAFHGDPQRQWRRTVAIGTQRGIPLSAMAASLAYYDSYRREQLPQNLIQAQRDFFGAHTYERMDREGVFHTPWKPEQPLSSMRRKKQ